MDNYNQTPIKDVFVDTLFYYYATYLAARLAGMKQQDSQQLAYYCQTMSELQSGSPVLRPWHYQDYKFTPCVTGQSDTQAQEGHEGRFGSFHCELAFQHLPTLQETHVKPVSASPAVTKVEPIAESAPGPESDKVTCHYYNPLTDIDWQHGGQFRPGFSQKLANKHHEVKPPESESSPYFDWREGKIELEEGICSTASKPLEDEEAHQPDTRLNCVANSDFARTMLNDGIYKARYQSTVKGMELALLGCRLYAYQNTWQHELATEMSPEERAVRLLDAYYWTQYAIECYLQGKPMDSERSLAGHDKPELNYGLEQSLKALFLFSGESLEGEYMWLRRMPALLANYGQGPSPIFVNWREGLRYRPNHLLEQAMLASGTGGQRQIKLLQGFKASQFFKLNKAAEYHADWLARHLSHKGLTAYATTQSLGHQDMWRLQ